MKIMREDTYDFIVCGGGMSGFATAVSAAKKAYLLPLWSVQVALAERPLLPE